MGISHDTLAAFSNALLEAHAVVRHGGRPEKLAEALRAVFGDCTVQLVPSVRTEQAIRPGANVLTLGSQRAAWRIMLRHPKRFTVQQRALVERIQAHLDLAHDPARTHPGQTSSPPRRARPPGLTPREADVLHWIRLGKRNREIATILGVSVRTVGKHVENILRKLGVETRGAAARTADEGHGG